MDVYKLQKLLPWFIFLIFTRLLPHPPNAAPIFCAALALSYFLPKYQIIGLGVLAFIISDIAIGFLHHYPVFGLWSFFTYSGLIATLFLGTAFLTDVVSLSRIFYALVSSTVFFWIWTNFGVWLTTVLYPKTMLGLMVCFVAAIPFLNNALLGNLVLGVIIFPLFLYKRNLSCAWIFY